MDERSWVAKRDDANACACPDGALWEILTSAGGFMMDSIWDATDKDVIWLI